MDFSIHSLKSDVYKFLENTHLKADIVFADPPYDFKEADFLKIATLVFEKQLLKEGGVLIIEHAKQTKLSDHLQFSYEKRYGSNAFSFFEQSNS